jgi:DNA-directed RNA polymerase subunit RPC12/RpoP
MSTFPECSGERAAFSNMMVDPAPGAGVSDHEGDVLKIHLRLSIALSVQSNASGESAGLAHALRRDYHRSESRFLILLAGMTIFDRTMGAQPPGRNIHRGTVARPVRGMAKPNDQKPLTVRCPNCKQIREPDYNESTRHYVCPICASQVDAQVLIEKKKRGLP